MNYTSRLYVISNHDNRLRLSSSSSSSYSFQQEIFRSTLIVLPNSNRKRFIQGIEIRCGNFINDSITSKKNYYESLSRVDTPSDIYSGDESISEYYPPKTNSIIGESYFDIRHRLLAKSNLFAHTLRDDTDGEDNEIFSYSSMGHSYGHRHCYKD